MVGIFILQGLGFLCMGMEGEELVAKNLPAFHLIEPNRDF
jgi:hypothetical protein